MHRVNGVNESSLRKIFSLLIFHLGLFSFLRLLFLVWNWAQFQTQAPAEIALAFVLGLRFDLSAAILVLSPWLLVALIAPFFRLSKRMSWLYLSLQDWLFSATSFGLYVLLTLPLWALNIIDLEFVNFVGRRFSAASLFIFREFKGGGAQSFILPYWHWIILELTFLFFFFRGQWKIWKRVDLFKGAESPPFDSLSLAARGLGLNFLILVLAVVGVRGGLQKKPLSFVHANIFVTPIQNNLVLNSTFTILKSLKKEGLGRETYFSKSSDWEALLNGSIRGPSLLAGNRPLRQPNVVIFVLESFALEFMGPPTNQSQGFTPFLDELARGDLGPTVFFDRAFANGRRSIEGIASIYAGIPSLMDEPFISSEFAANYFVGLGTLLGKEGYHTSFFHGAENGSMYFDTFMKSAGVKNYLGAQDYPRSGDHDGAWGIYDEPFLSFFAEKLSTYPQPFFSGLFTLSSHPPYVLPEKYKSKFPPGPLDISASIAYTDYSLRQFFSATKDKPWYKNTIFILTADHTQKSFRPEYDNVLGRYLVPLIFFAPGGAWPQVDTHQVAQHIDILPTILDILDIKTDSSIWLGRSLFIPGEKTVTNYLEPGFLLVNSENFLIWNRPQEPLMFSIKDLQQKHPLSSPSETKIHLENRLKASLQYFSQGLWDQKLYFPSR